MSLANQGHKKEYPLCKYILQSKGRFHKYNILLKGGFGVPHMTVRYLSAIYQPLAVLKLRGGGGGGWEGGGSSTEDPVHSVRFIFLLSTYVRGPLILIYLLSEDKPNGWVY